MEKRKLNSTTRTRDGAKLSPWQQSWGDYPGKSTGAGADPDKVYDCLIIGAGITGVTTALLLQQAGQNCLLAEAVESGFGTTGGTTAHLNTFFDATYLEVEKDFSADAARLLARGGKQALDEIRDFVTKLDIACDLEFKPAWLYAENEKESGQLETLLNAAKRAGLQ